MNDYAHCVVCDKVIDLDNDIFTTDENSTYCQDHLDDVETDWVEELEYYEDFIGWDDDRKQDYSTISQHKAKERLREHLEFIIGINGTSELYKWEKELIRKLGIKED